MEQPEPAKDDSAGKQIKRAGGALARSSAEGAVQWVVGSVLAASVVWGAAMTALAQELWANWYISLLAVSAALSFGWMISCLVITLIRATRTISECARAAGAARAAVSAAEASVGAAEASVSATAIKFETLTDRVKSLENAIGTHSDALHTAARAGDALSTAVKYAADAQVTTKAMDAYADMAKAAMK